MTTDVEIPAVAATSIYPDGYGPVAGFGARLNLADAARDAVFVPAPGSAWRLHVVAAKRLDPAMRRGGRKLIAGNGGQGWL